jgi:hypothetical protein
MYLHIGNNKNIRKKSLIGIFDMESTTQSAVTKEFLKEIQKENKVENISHDLPKSLVVTDNVIYLSPTAVKSFKNR